MLSYSVETSDKLTPRSSRNSSAQFSGKRVKLRFRSTHCHLLIIVIWVILSVTRTVVALCWRVTNSCACYRMLWILQQVIEYFTVLYAMLICYQQPASWPLAYRPNDHRVTNIIPQRVFASCLSNAIHCMGQNIKSSLYISVCARTGIGGRISRKRLEIEVWFQWDTNRKWHMADRLVAWRWRHVT